MSVLDARLDPRTKALERWYTELNMKDDDVLQWAVEARQNHHIPCAEIKEEDQEEDEIEVMDEEWAAWDTTWKPRKPSPKRMPVDTRPKTDTHSHRVIKRFAKRDHDVRSRSTAAASVESVPSEASVPGVPKAFRKRKPEEPPGPPTSEMSSLEGATDAQALLMRFF